MKTSWFLILGFLLASPFAYGLKPDFDSVSKYHQEQIEQLLKDYTLEDSLNIRIELKKKQDLKADEEAVSLPGIYLKTGETDSDNIEKILNLYERRVVFIKKRQISEQEQSLVEGSLKERLFLPEETQFTVLDDVPKFDDTVKNLGNDFLFGSYNNLIKKGQFLWIMVFAIGFFLALWILTRVWKKSPEESAGGGEISFGGSGTSPQASESQSGGGSDGPQTISLSSADFETFNFESFCENINAAFEKAPGSCAHILWSKIGDLESQIKLHEIIRIQSEIDSKILNKTQKALDSIFSFEERAARNSASRKAARGFDKNTLSTVSVELARLKFLKADKTVEGALQAIYPNMADSMDHLFEEGAAEHHLVLYKLFKEDFMSYISSKDTSGEGAAELLNIINELLTFDPDNDDLEADQYKSFTSFLKTIDVGEAGKSSKKSVNSNVLQMLYGLSDDELKNVKALQNDELLKAKVPTLEWVSVEDTAALKSFVNALNGTELACLKDTASWFDEGIQSLDERTQFRVKERMNQNKDDTVNWKALRDKIGQHFSYGKAGENNELSKAS